MKTIRPLLGPRLHHLVTVLTVTALVGWLCPMAVHAARYSPGDRVVTTARVNARPEPTMNVQPLGTLKPGSVGTLKEGPRRANNYRFWRIVFVGGVEGWCVSSRLRPYVPVEGEESPPPVETSAPEKASQIKAAATNVAKSPPLALGPAPSRYLLDRVEDVPLAQTAKTALPLPEGPPPAKGEPFIDPETGHRVTRITDVNDIPPHHRKGGDRPLEFDGHPDRGFYNGYSRWTNVNVTGEYAVAFRHDNHSALYRLADCAYRGPVRASHKTVLGETHEIRWDRSGRPGTETTIYYHVGGRFSRQDVIKGHRTAEALHDFGMNIVPTVEMDSDDGARYWPLRLEDGMCVVFDAETRQVLPGKIKQRPNALDISPRGEWLYILDHTNEDPALRARLYRIADLARGDTSAPVYLPTASKGHDGWALDARGQEVVVFQDNKNDWFSSFNPASGERIDIFNMVETGYGFGQHMGRLSNPLKKGWLMISSYTVEDEGWADNQILIVEIKPHNQHPRIWRVSPTFNRRWVGGVDTGGYFAEAFASFDHEGNNIYVGANWMGRDNLELYRIELPPDWHRELAAEESIALRF